MAKRWTKIEEDYLIEERAEGVPLISIALVLGRSYDSVCKRLELLRKLAINEEPEVSPDIDWKGIPPEHKYAWLVIDPTAKGFTWCTSKTLPKLTPQGYNGACIRIWNGSGGVKVRMGVDFRTIFRQRLEATNE